MFQINSLTLSCRVVGAPEYAETRQGRGKVKLRISQPSRVKDPATGEHQTKMMFFTALAFGTVADQINRQISEAQDLTIRGELKHREYVDRSNQRREVYEILIESFVPGLTREQRDQQPRRSAPEPPATPVADTQDQPTGQRTFNPGAAEPDVPPAATGPAFAPTYASTPTPADDPEPTRTDQPAVPGAADEAKKRGGLKLPW